MNRLRHIAFILLYAVLLFNTGLNAIFPLYFLEIFGIKTSRMINFFVYRVNSAVSTMILKVLGIKLYLYQKKGNKIDPKKMDGTTLVTPNHIGEFDPFFVGCILSYSPDMFPSDRMLQIFVKQSIALYPIIGPFMLASRALFVRYGKQRRSDDQKYYVDQLTKDSETAKTILMFPEGGIKRLAYKAEMDKRGKEFDAPEYKNVVTPRTSGAHMIAENLSLKTHILMTIRHVTGGQEDLSIYDAGRFFNGETPHEVHILMEENPIDSTHVADRKQFDQDFYQSFKKIDTNLGESLKDWENKYEKVQICPKWMDLVWSTILIGSSIAPFWFYTNPYYIAYLATGITFFTVQGVRAYF
jgi:1-acyl-sn-glycerol-3-phosphate acyltransferase